MANFDEALNLLLRDEGGYNPDDCGSEGYKGIRRGNWNKWPGWTIIDNMKHTGSLSDSFLEQNKELQNLVKSFYYNEFWDPISGDEINSNKIANSIFNFAVNAGLMTTVKLAQTSLKIQSDGIFGGNTLRTINNTNEAYFLSEFCLEKIKRYIQIVKDNSDKSKYLLNWIDRAISYSQ
jgi:lysozyme family protein